MAQIKKANIPNIRTDFVNMIHFGHILIAVLLSVEAIWYPQGFTIDFAIEILLSACVALFYLYMKEAYALFAFNHLTKNQLLKNEVIKDDDHEETMFKDKPPFNSFRGCARINMIDLYSAYLYVMNGYAMRFFVWKKPVNDYKTAQPFMRRLNILLILYFSVVPILMGASWAIWEFATDDGVKIAGRVKLSTIVNILIVIFTLITFPKVTAFCKSFKKFFPFWNGGSQVH